MFELFAKVTYTNLFELTSILNVSFTRLESVYPNSHYKLVIVALEESIINIMFTLSFITQSKLYNNTIIFIICYIL